MNDENKRAKPDCPLIGEDGNIFNLIGIAAKMLRRNGMSAEASEMTKKVYDSGSYEEALGIIGEYVNITSVDVADEDTKCPYAVNAVFVHKLHRTRHISLGKHTRIYTFMVSHSGGVSRHKTACVFGEIKIGVHIEEI